MAMFTRFVCGLWFVLVTGAVGYAQDASLLTEDEVSITFRVDVPVSTPEADTIYLCGDHELFGNWDGRGLELQRDYDGSYRGVVSLPRGVVVQFKATRGSWDTVEKGLAGGEITNRELIADQPHEVELVVEAWARDQTPRPEPSLTGDIRMHEGFRSEILDNERTLIVYLPPGYGDPSEARYPVLYMQDGQNIFDSSTSFAGTEWMVDEAAERLIKAEEIEPIIIVGIYNNADRMREYTPRPSEGQADAYSRFVVQEVKPFIDRTYRTDPSREKTGIAGSSLGGLISLYMVWAHADTFGRCGGVSPSLFLNDRWLIEQWRVSDMGWAADARIWIDMGTREGRASQQTDGVSTAVADARTLVWILQRAGLQRGEDFVYMEVEGGEHNEQAWSQRIDTILRYLYGNP